MIDIEPCFPDNYRILDFYITTINKQIDKYIDLLMNQLNEMDYSDKLALLYWIRIEYHLAIEDFTTKNTHPLNFKERIIILMDDYVIDRHKMMMEGCHVAVEQDFKEMKPIPKPNTNYPYTPSH